MLIKQVIEMFDLLDDAHVSGAVVKDRFEKMGARDVKVTRAGTQERGTDFVRILIPGTHGKSSGGDAPTLGILGRLGGLGARPEMIGFVSDGDGALSALSAGAKLLDMKCKGDDLEGDVIVSTHICPNAPTQPHDPVPFMGSPVEMATTNSIEVTPDMDAILSIDTTKGNRIINKRGFAISPTVKDGYILRVAEPLLDIMQTVTGTLPAVFAITQQDISPYGNGLYHLNSIMQPATATTAPVVGVAVTTETMVPGCGTGASHFSDVEEAARFAVEVAKLYGRKKCPFYDEAEYEKIQNKYGSLSHFRTQGKA